MSIVRVHNQRLSLWQSAVSETVKKQHRETHGAEPAMEVLLEHPWVQATNRFVLARHHRTEPEYDHANLASVGSAEDALTAMSSLLFDIASAHVEGRLADELQLRASYWPYSNQDPGFLSCEVTYAEYYAWYNGKFLYNDWTIQGQGNINYGVIEWQIPNDGVVAVIGDWGTGLPDAAALLAAIAKVPRLAAVIHIGDIYYSGTPTECLTHFLDIVNTYLSPRRIPVFTMPGNHEYYCLGYGYYPMLKALNGGIVGAEQEASYFCLRTKDNGWQFLGMDTGYNDSNPVNQIDPLYAGPWLQNTEVQWHWDKLRKFAGSTILLSHHMVFSTNSEINGKDSSFSEFPYLNPFLLNSFQPFLKTKVAAWLWGHEHNFAVFQNNIFGVAKGRLVGASAFEIEQADDPYKVNYPEVPYLQPTNWMLPTQPDTHYPHSYVLIDFAGRQNPTSPVNVTYYRFPSWYPVTPPNPQPTLLFQEQFSKPIPPNQENVLYGAPINMALMGGTRYYGKTADGFEYYPTVAATPLRMTLYGFGKSQILDGDSLYIQTLETWVGRYKYLYCPETHWLYYSDGGLSTNNWIIHKLDKSVDNIIRYGDAVYFESSYYKGRNICPTNDGYLTTTTDQPPVYFTLQRTVVEEESAVIQTEEAVPALEG